MPTSGSNYRGSISGGNTSSSELNGIENDQRDTQSGENHQQDDVVFIAQSTSGPDCIGTSTRPAALIQDAGVRKPAGRKRGGRKRGSKNINQAQYRAEFIARFEGTQVVSKDVAVPVTVNEEEPGDAQGPVPGPETNQDECGNPFDANTTANNATNGDSTNGDATNGDGANGDANKKESSAKSGGTKYRNLEWNQDKFKKLAIALIKAKLSGERQSSQNGVASSMNGNVYSKAADILIKDDEPNFDNFKELKEATASSRENRLKNAFMRLLMIDKVYTRANDGSISGMDEEYPNKSKVIYAKGLTPEKSNTDDDFDKFKSVIKTLTNSEFRTCALYSRDTYVLHNVVAKLKSLSQGEKTGSVTEQQQALEHEYRHAFANGQVQGPAVVLHGESREDGPLTGLGGPNNGNMQAEDGARYEDSDNGSSNSAQSDSGTPRYETRDTTRDTAYDTSFAENVHCGPGLQKPTSNPEYSRGVPHEFNMRYDSMWAYMFEHDVSAETLLDISFYRLESMMHYVLSHSDADQRKERFRKIREGLKRFRTLSESPARRSNTYDPFCDEKDYRVHSSPATNMDESGIDRSWPDRS